MPGASRAWRYSPTATLTSRRGSSGFRSSRCRAAFSITDNAESEGGVVAGEDFIGRNNTAGVGYSYLNTAFSLAKATAKASSFASPIVHQQTYELRDVYRASGALSVFANVAMTQASATATSAIDPRLSVLFTRGPRDVVRASAGATTTQPSGDMLDHPFVPQQLVSAGGGGGIRCGALNSIGNVPSSALHPERGVDEELSYAHGFGGDAYAQLALYDLHVYDKLYSTIVPLASTGGGFVNAAFLAQQEAAIAAACPTQDPATLVGVTGTYNVGALHARGFTFSGRARLDRRTFLDYAWVLDSTVIVSAPVPLLQSNLKLIPGGQLPSLPLHTLDASLDRLAGRSVDVRYTFHWVADNNTKRLRAYDSSDLRVSVPVARAVLSLEIDNLFNQDADIRGLCTKASPTPSTATRRPRRTCRISARRNRSASACRRAPSTSTRRIACARRASLRRVLPCERRCARTGRASRRRSRFGPARRTARRRARSP